VSLALRPYQQAAIDGLFSYWEIEAGNPLLVIPTGGGKSLVMAEVIQRLLGGWPDMRIAVVTHVKELIAQNYTELVGIWPFAPAGIYSAGLGRRDAHAQILFAGIQTVHNKARQIGHVDIVLVDEAHLIPRNADTQYGRFLLDLAAINPDLKIVGLTATPFRLDSGRLDDGEERLFDKIAYEITIRELIELGFLSPLISKGMSTGFDLTGVQKRGGDYVPGQLQAAVDKYETTRAAVSEIVAYGESRRSWLCFCSGVDHALHVRDEIKARGFTCETVTGDTPAGERDRILRDFKAGRIRALTNNSVLTTGFNAPGVDLIAFLRPTKSTGLYIQMAGRGTRLAPGKENCLVLDFAGLVRDHGPVDAVEPKTPGDGSGEAPVKECPMCHSLVHASLMVCKDCGHQFPENTEEKISAKAADLPILSTGAAKALHVESRSFHYHDKPGGTPSVRTAFDCGVAQHKTWICPQHTGFAKSKADRFWSDHKGLRPFPRSVDEFLKRQDELHVTDSVTVKPNGRYFEVTAYTVGAERQEATHYVPPKPFEYLDEDIPF
jgi:DNA repair protein RadD